MVILKELYKEKEEFYLFEVWSSWSDQSEKFYWLEISIPTSGTFFEGRVSKGPDLLDSKCRMEGSIPRTKQKIIRRTNLVEGRKKMARLTKWSDCQGSRECGLTCLGSRLPLATESSPSSCVGLRSGKRYLRKLPMPLFKRMARIDLQ